MRRIFCSIIGLLTIFVINLSFVACGGGEKENSPKTEHTEHEYATKWSKDESSHWHDPICDDTTERKDETTHEFNIDHACNVCGYTKSNLGMLTIGDITAWADVESEFKLMFSDETKAEPVTYEYDNSKIVLDKENKTIKSLNGFVGSVQIKVRSEHHKTATFTVFCNELPIAGVRKYTAYAQKLGAGVLVDNNGNDTGATFSISENTTVFIGDSFFDRRWFWTDFYTEDFKGKDAFLAGISEATTNDWEAYMSDVFKAFGDSAPKNIAIHLGTNNIGTGQTAAETENCLRHFLTVLHRKFPRTMIYYFSITRRWDDGGSTYNGIINEVNGQTQAWCKNKDWVRYIDTSWRITKDMLNSNHGGSFIHPLLSTYTVFVEQLKKAGCEIAVKV